MKIIDILKSDQPTISCELFPPKTGEELNKAKEIVADMATLKPSFMSVTYGAGGGISHHTVDIADTVNNKHGIPALAHLTCYSSNREKIVSVLDSLKEHKIENILALRGDIPAGCERPKDAAYNHASELIKEIRAYDDSFCIGGACYPEGHPDSPSIDADIDGLKYKIDAGCQFLTTQMFFDNHIMYNFMMRAMSKGINVPIVAGIMPVTNKKQIARTCALSGTALPPRFKAIADRFGDNPAAMKQAGIAYATEQIIDLVANGVNHIHIYTMNKPDIAGGIMQQLSEIF
ncbi:MAG: methylenetetrahydrofolate reductase [NAD(P)H] [Lachnospiraceae bacterium]